MSYDLMISEKKRVALVSVLAAVFLTSMKLIVGILTMSLGVLSEAAHSGLDLIAAIVTLLAVRVSDRPADEEHAYGHGKVESLSALFETILLFVTCMWIIYEAIRRIFVAAPEVQATYYAFIIIITSIFIDIWRSTALKRIAKKYNSQALAADALHFSSDIYSSAVVILGLVMVRIGFPIGDSIAALGVAIFVIFASVRLGKTTIDTLLDRAPFGAKESIYKMIKSIEGIQDCDRIRIRQAGNTYFIDLNIQLDQTLDLERAHEIMQNVEEKVFSLFPNSDVVVHANPAINSNDIPHLVKHITRELNMPVEAHNIQSFEIKGRRFIDLHLRVPDEMNIKIAHDLADRLEEEMGKTLDGKYEISVKLESSRAGQRDSKILKYDIDRIKKRIESLILSFEQIKQYHNLLLREENNKIYVTVHCIYQDNMEMSKISELNHKIEDIIKAEFPNVASIIIHSEPLST
ncbi:MAG: cation-efflux pump [Actinobacteria bacterium]|nr:cation-efflux pump [Actinomycetota bacterium]